MKTLLGFAIAFVCSFCARGAFHPDIEYGHAAGERLLLDASIPDGAGPFPAVILVHGGGWNSGDKSGGTNKGLMAPMHAPLEAGGFAWFSVNYRLAPKHPYPACVDDVEAAIRWVFAHAADYKIDPRRIALSGESAGAHVMVMAATRVTPGVPLAALVAFYGRYDLANDVKAGAELSPNIAALIGHKFFDEEAKPLLRRASPVHFVHAGLPATLLVHGTADQKVPFAQSEMLQAKLRTVHVPCELMPIAGGAHGMLGWPAKAPNFKQDVVAWLTRTLAKGS